MSEELKLAAHTLVQHHHGPDPLPVFVVKGRAGGYGVAAMLDDGYDAATAEDMRDMWQGVMDRVVALTFEIPKG